MKTRASHRFGIETVLVEPRVRSLLGIIWSAAATPVVDIPFRL
ncbi:MAG: hypothetical protein ACSI46_02735 [Gloeotrichia echinulata DVL01]